MAAGGARRRLAGTRGEASAPTRHPPGRLHRPGLGNRGLLLRCRHVHEGRAQPVQGGCRSSVRQDGGGRAIRSGCVVRRLRAQQIGYNGAKLGWACLAWSSAAAPHLGVPWARMMSPPIIAKDLKQARSDATTLAITDGVSSWTAASPHHGHMLSACHRPAAAG